MMSKRSTKSASELRAMISAARREIAKVPGANKQIGMTIRLDAQERRLFGSKSK
jgi:hypothetical protein